MRWLVLSLLAIAPALARAQSPQDEAAATALFDEGRALMKQQQFPAACAKFEASVALAARLGSRLNLADCYERVGRLASAWALYGEVAVAAAREGDRREAHARARLQALEPRLARMVITLGAGAEVAGLTISRDGTALPAALLDSALPVDAGPHTIAVRAPGRSAWSTEVTARDGETVTVEVPPLAEAEVVTEPPPVDPGVAAGNGTPAPSRGPVDRPAGRGRRIAGLVVGAIGLAGLGAGSVLGLSAKGKWDDAQAHCNAEVECDREGVDLVNQARDAGDLATIGFAVGAAGVVAGLVLYLTAPDGRPSPTAGVGLAPRSGGGVVVWTGTF